MRPASRLRASAVVAMRGCRGFTLVELMVVLVIVGLMGAAVVLTAPDDSRTLVREADTFAARLVHAGEEAILTVRGVQVTVAAHGYAVERQSLGQWQAREEGPFDPLPCTGGTPPMPCGRPPQAPL